MAQMSRTEELAQSFRETVMESRPAQFFRGLTLVRAIIGFGVGLMGIGLTLLVLVTLIAIAANLSPLQPLRAGGGALLLALEGFSVVVLSSEFVE